MKSCIYCGDVCEARDHVIPCNYAMITRSFSVGETVPCCTHCNSILGDRHILTIDLRASYVHSILTKKKKYRKILETQYWCEEDLNELGYSLREMFRSMQMARRWLERRIDNLELVSEGFDASPIDDPFRQLYASIICDLIEN